MKSKQTMQELVILTLQLVTLNVKYRYSFYQTNTFISAWIFEHVFVDKNRHRLSRLMCPHTKLNKQQIVTVTNEPSSLEG